MTAAQVTNIAKRRTFRTQDENANVKEMKMTPKDIGTIVTISHYIT
jgi:hypothetical protein